MSKVKMHENPLVPNKKLKQMYVAMIEARALDECATRVAARAKNGRPQSTRGQEACRVSTAIDLRDGDLVCDSQDGVVMQRIAGASAASLLARLNAIRSGTKHRAAGTRGSGTAQILPWVADASDRVRMALGAALAFKSLGRESIVVTYVYSCELPEAIWRQVLGLAARLELPIIFVALPEDTGRKGARSLSAKAQACGVPGFPVDTTDAVALYRVAQESIGRARGKGGAVVINCMSPALPGEGNDPIAQMKSFMLARKVANKSWLDSAGRSFRDRLKAGSR